MTSNSKKEKQYSRAEIENLLEKLPLKIQDGNVNATYNWWGTTSETLIEQYIFDYYDDYNQGKVTFAPFLNDSNTFFTISASAGQMEQ